MGFRISALNADEFSHLVGLDDVSLAENGARRMTVDLKPGYPCRVTLEDAEIGESVLLVSMMVGADVVHGKESEPVIRKLLDNPRVEYLHVHNAKPGCYAARVDRL